MEAHDGTKTVKLAWLGACVCDLKEVEINPPSPQRQRGEIRHGRVQPSVEAPIEVVGQQEDGQGVWCAGY